MSFFLLMAASVLLSPSQRLPLAGFLMAPRGSRHLLKWVESFSAGAGSPVGKER